MRFFTDWDDLVHGTLVFGAALPFAIALAAGLMLRSRPWIGAAAALGVTLVWLFGPPGTRFGSDDAPGWALAAAVVAAVFAESARCRNCLAPLTRMLLLAALAWACYPAWLAVDGGTARRALVAALLAISVGGLACAGERLAGRPGDGRFSLSAAAFVPAGAGVAVLLAIGGASQFAQAAGAAAAALSALAVLQIVRAGNSSTGAAVGLVLTLMAFLAWAGWLYAEIRPAAAALVCLSPFTALATRWLPLPRQRAWQVLAWDLLAAAVVAGSVLAVVLADETTGSALGY